VTWPPEDEAAGAGALDGAVAVAAVAARAAGRPTSSSTTGAFANGSFGVDCFAGVTTCECESLTTGTVCVVVTRCVTAGAVAGDATT
jgi:hypothetical protein